MESGFLSLSLCGTCATWSRKGDPRDGGSDKAIHHKAWKGKDPFCIWRETSLEETSFAYLAGHKQVKYVPVLFQHSELAFLFIGRMALPICKRETAISIVPQMPKKEIVLIC